MNITSHQLLPYRTYYHSIRVGALRWAKGGLFDRFLITALGAEAGGCFRTPPCQTDTARYVATIPLYLWLSCSSLIFLISGFRFFYRDILYKLIYRVRLYCSACSRLFSSSHTKLPSCFIFYPPSSSQHWYWRRCIRSVSKSDKSASGIYNWHTLG